MSAIDKIIKNVTTAQFNNKNNKLVQLVSETTEDVVQSPLKASIKNKNDIDTMQNCVSNYNRAMISQELKPTLHEHTALVVDGQEVDSLEKAFLLLGGHFDD